ncbi:hypothetical protein IWX50DRAFT_348263 [Phyllosticta citricarpa]
MAKKKEKEKEKEIRIYVLVQQCNTRTKVIQSTTTTPPPPPPRKPTFAYLPTTRSPTARLTTTQYNTTPRHGYRNANGACVRGAGMARRRVIRRTHTRIPLHSSRLPCSFAFWTGGLDTHTRRRRRRVMGRGKEGQLIDRLVCLSVDGSRRWYDMDFSGSALVLGLGLGAVGCRREHRWMGWDGHLTALEGQNTEKCILIFCSLPAFRLLLHFISAFLLD